MLSCTSEREVEEARHANTIRYEHAITATQLLEGVPFPNTTLLLMLSYQSLCVPTTQQQTEDRMTDIEAHISLGVM